jgi:ABC-type Na+ transport system ATPase subunit NatA
MLAYIPDNPDLYEHLTGIQYLNFIGDVYRIPKGEREERIRSFADRFELTGDLGDLTASYSHGMKQKLALHHRRIDPSAQAAGAGRALRGPGPQGSLHAEDHHA